MTDSSPVRAVRAGSRPEADDVPARPAIPDPPRAPAWYAAAYARSAAADSGRIAAQHAQNRAAAARDGYVIVAEHGNDGVPDAAPGRPALGRAYVANRARFGRSPDAGWLAGALDTLGT